MEKELEFRGTITVENYVEMADSISNLSGQIRSNVLGMAKEATDNNLLGNVEVVTQDQDKVTSLEKQTGLLIRHDDFGRRWHVLTVQDMYICHSILHKNPWTGIMTLYPHWDHKEPADRWDWLEYGLRAAWKLIDKSIGTSRQPGHQA